MSMRRRMRMRRAGGEAKVDMNSLIDLTFLLLVVFIVTLPTLEQTVHIVLPTGKTESQKKDEKQKNYTVSIDKQGMFFLGDVPVDEKVLTERLTTAVKDDPEANVLVRGDVGAKYGDIYKVIKIAKECNVKHLGMVSKEH